MIKKAKPVEYYHNNSTKKVMYEVYGVGEIQIERNSIANELERISMNMSDNSFTDYIQEIRFLAKGLRE